MRFDFQYKTNLRKLLTCLQILFQQGNTFSVFQFDIFQFFIPGLSDHQSFDNIIMIDYHYPVSSQLHIKFGTIHSGFGGLLKACNRVLGRTFCFPEATVSNNLSLCLCRPYKKQA